jgi:hypothetical protein
MPVFFKNKRLAELIRTGLKMDVNESKSHWLARYPSGDCYACALGLAMIGQMGIFRANVAFVEALQLTGDDEIIVISKLLQIESLLAEEINRLHNLDVPAEEIAEALEFEIGEDVLDAFQEES